MPNLYKQILLIVLTLLLGIMVYFGVQAYKEAKLYEKSTTELVSHKSAQEQAEYKLKELAEELLLGFYRSDKKEALDKIRLKQQEHKIQAQSHTLYFAAALLGILSSYLLVSLRLFTLFGSLAALVTLFFGLVTPVLMVTIHKEIEYLGDVVLSFESKGVIGSIEKLFGSGDTVVALVILLFSVLIPMVKTLSLLFVAMFMENRFAHGMVTFFKMIGKWSMVDVFVVATFLVYLTSSHSKVSQAEVEVGLYLFLMYVIVSMLVSLSADKLLHQQTQEV